MRRVRKRGGNKEKVFGCDLLEHLTASSQEIPQVLRCCSEFVEHHGIVDGIYRLSGVSSNIQKLRGEFESDGNPDLNKDVYLQDIHCVSSLCKAYFRELPNPLLTYQLYDKFAEAVAIQLEGERLVKIRDVLKELPTPHYRTLEFLMRHLVKMASHSSETNMHARNLAIVWAPNLLRSKDIEATGFNGTAAFMEVRVQSIVVEFILTHVPQLFPEQAGVSSERRKSLPSPSAESNQDEPLFRSVPAPHNFGNISPGDGPLPIRPYHAIIEGTDKRKGSLKGRKWMSIFNIGGRFPDPRRRNKHSAKEKDRASLRPARSMDSLSTQSYPNEGSRRSDQCPPSSNMSPQAAPSPAGPDAPASSGALGGSEYAVTYRRGTGLVSGGAGTQGTYTALDPEGLGAVGNETLQSRSPGQSTKAGRRAAMHITGPTMVTVPLHITSNLALGMLQQGGSSNRVVHRGRDKEGGDREDDKNGGEKVTRKERRERQTKEEKGGKVEEREKGEVVDVDEDTTGTGGVGEEKAEVAKEEEKKEEEVKEDGGQKSEVMAEGVSEEQRTQSYIFNTDDKAPAQSDRYIDDISEYMDMRSMEQAGSQPGDTSDVFNSTEVEGDDQELFGYVQDNFEFLDHMDCSISYPVHEFSVEPPGHSDDEYEIMLQTQPSPVPAELHSPTEPNPHRPLSLDLHSRHTKSLSLPYMTSPINGPDESCSEEEDTGDDSDDDDYSSEEDESMFYKSLPADFLLSSLSGLETDALTQASCIVDQPPVDPPASSEEREPETLESEEPPSGDQEPAEVIDHNEGPEEKQAANKEEKGNQPENHLQSVTTEEDLHITEDEFPPPISDDDDNEFTIEIEEEKDSDDADDGPPCLTDSCVTQETGDVSPQESGEHYRQFVHGDAKERIAALDDEGEDGRADREIETVCQEALHDEKRVEDPIEEAGEGAADRNGEEETQKSDEEPDSAICSGEIWEELEEVVCEVIEDKESEQEEEAQRAKISGDKIIEMEEGRINKTEGEGEWMQKVEEKLTDSEMQQETRLPETSEVEEATHTVNEESHHHDREEVVSSDRDRGEEHPEKTPPRADKHRQEARPDQRTPKCDKSDSSRGGVGRKLVVSKNPKVFQVKAVPVVPPKPQHCKLTAMTLRQQQQERERRDADRGRENVQRVHTTEQDRAAAAAAEPGRDEWASRDANRGSPLSMCFDEAVAIATMRRERERECEKERERQRDWENEV
ncbi:rho GTPase-activating protein 31 [Echeneis naucrates]|uniref:rho GTPase-activating protein 31 n=1 Tax=Echeneis naucrates TaxID=173247 RepID=UPI0011140B39|nr:rho GTPase-activating protein 30 [Echeneis naucrates]XP_029381593.1 rho GTPase-activating protein 30 [Echeneis naucrates]